MTFGDALAARVRELETERAKLRWKVTRLERSRDLWRHRALAKAGLSRGV